MEEPALHLDPKMNSSPGLADGGLMDHRASRGNGRSRASITPTSNPTFAPRFGAATPEVVASAISTPAPVAPVTIESVSAGERSDALIRVLNVVIAGIAMLVLAPVYMVVALLVWVTSPGPIFYTQTRIGLDRRGGRAAAMNERRLDDLGGQPFTIIKFRSMRVNAEVGGQAVWASKHDNRVTPVGGMLRKTRLDEIPQLMNVLRGEMNIVGPRPERPSIVVRLREEIAEYPLRHRVKPGITGWAQINHSYDATIEDVRRKVQFDLEYIAQRSVWTDFKIMVMTIPVMLFRRGAH
jgi:lipopolysaccharide/colanic/teichoic acid biosynthesis glycosyltransferase